MQNGYCPRTPRLLKNFLFLVWKHLRLPDPTPRQYELADALQFGSEREMLQAFRGIGKSWICSAFVVWTLDHHPDWNILVVSASKSRADDFSTFCMRLIKEIPCLQHLRPGPEQRDSKISFDVGPAPASHAPSVKSLGITSQLTGSRADIIVVDDTEVPANSQTQVMRDKLAEAVKEFDAILKPLKTARIIFLGTPQHEQSVYNKLPERGFKIRIWPARVPKLKDLKFYGDKLAPSIREGLVNGALREGQPTDTRFNEMDLAKREASYGRTGFALQFMLNTSLTDAERFPLKLRDLVVMDVQAALAPEHAVWAGDDTLVINDLPNVGMPGDKFHRPMAYQGNGVDGVALWIPYTGVVMTIDPSGKGADELGYCIIGMLNGQLFVLACAGLTGGYAEENLLKLALEAKKFRVTHIIVEENFGGGMFAELLKPVLAKHHPCFVEEVHHSTQKEARIIDTLEPAMNSHRLIMDRKVIEQDYLSTQERGDDALKYQLIYQMTRITKERGCLRHDDRLDALAMAVAYWTKQMAHDVQKDIKAAHSKALQKELDEFVKVARSPHGVSNKGLVTINVGAGMRVGYRPGPSRSNWIGSRGPRKR
ncbi:MAG: phage terminase large subunit [Cetobacterium sp.]